MSRFKNVTSLLVAALLSTSGTIALADNHEEEAKGAPVDFWACSFNKGKDMDDLDKAIDAFNAWADENDDSYTAWVLTPQYFSSELGFDIGWLGGWPDGNAWGKHQDAWMSTGQGVFQGFMKVVDCESHEMATSLAINVSNEPVDGLVLFSACEVSEGKNVMDAVAAHQELAAAYGGKSDANSWLFFPGAGSDLDADYWSVLGFENYSQLGAAWEGYTNGGGWEKFMDILGGTTQCGEPSTWSARRVTN